MSGDIIAFQSNDSIVSYPTEVSSWEYVSEGNEVINGISLQILNFIISTKKIFLVSFKQFPLCFHFSFLHCFVT